MPSKCGEEWRKERERESVCVGATASCCCWSSRSPFDVMQSALTKCQRQAKEPKPKASPDLTACLPCAFKISLATGLGLIVCVLFMLPFSFLFPLFHFDFFFLWALWKVAVVRLIGNVHLWHFVGTEQRPELFRIQTLCLISRYTYHLSFSFPTLNVFPQFPHKIAKCSLRPATIPQSLCLPPFCSLPFSECPSDSQLSALSGHRYSFRWLLTVVLLLVLLTIMNLKIMPDIFWHCRNGNYAINLCNSAASNMSAKAPQLSRHHEANGFERISWA